MDNRPYRIGFVGIGVLGKGLALALAAHSYPVVAAYSRSSSSAQWLVLVLTPHNVGGWHLDCMAASN